MTIERPIAAYPGPGSARQAFAYSAQGQDLCFLPGGPDRLEVLLDAIGQARETLDLCFYIFGRDDSAHRVRDALGEAARRGVAVTLILDGFGAEADERFMAPLVEAGGHCLRFSARWSQRYLIRNHQKIVIADGRRAIIGGFNVEDAYFAPEGQEGWEDLAVLIEGSAVDDLARWYAQLRDWTADPRANWRAIRRRLRDWQPGEGQVQLLLGGPVRGLSSWAAAVRRDLGGADRLDMIMAYFSPAQHLLRRIGAIARRGQVRLVMAAKSDNAATVGATRSLYDWLLRCGAQIWEFETRRLHTKLIVIDDTVYVGSANFDMRSLYLNLELMLRIEDAGLADRMREYIDGQVSESSPVTLPVHRRQATLWNRLRWNVSWFLVAVIDYTVSRRLNLGL